MLFWLTNNVEAMVERPDMFRENRIKTKYKWGEVIFPQIHASSCLGVAIGRGLKFWLEVQGDPRVVFLGMLLGAVVGALVPELIKLDGGDIGVSLSGALAAGLATQDLFGSGNMLFLSYGLGAGVGYMLDLALGVPEWYVEKYNISL